MSDEWWISPVDGHRHATRLVQGGADGPDVDDCAVCALEAERDRLRAVVAEADVLMRLCQNCHDDWRRYQAGHDMGEIVAGLPLPSSVENERLRAVVEAARHLTYCPLTYQHSDPNDPRALRIDCSDDQCRNPEHTRWKRCTMPQHDLAEALAALDISGTMGQAPDGGQESNPEASHSPRPAGRPWQQADDSKAGVAPEDDYTPCEHRNLNPGEPPYLVVCADCGGRNDGRRWLWRWEPDDEMRAAANEAVRQSKARDERDAEAVDEIARRALERIEREPPRGT